MKSRCLAPSRTKSATSSHRTNATTATQATTPAPENEPATGWRGAAMGNAGRDPVFWATLGVAEQDFDGAGDMCIRCHSTGGWYGGRSTPTDGSGLAASDDNGVDCDTCHTMTNPDNSDPILQGIMNPPFIANCSDDPIDPTAPASLDRGLLRQRHAFPVGGQRETGPLQRCGGTPPVHAVEVPPQRRLLRLLPRCIQPRGG